jgi:hypothetical protein
MVVPDLVVQRGRFGHERKLPGKFCVSRKALICANSRNTGAGCQSARESSDVAEVANRPKKRPGRRERSSITTRWQGMLV